MISETSKRMVSGINELANLRAEIASRLAELRSLQAEVNAIAIKWGIEPVPASGVLDQSGEPGAVLLAMPLEALE